MQKFAARSCAALHLYVTYVIDKQMLFTMANTCIAGRAKV
jgi:hypothetical protein